MPESTPRDLNLQGNWNFIHSYQSLPQILFKLIDPTKSNSPQLLFLNEDLAKTLDLDIKLLKSPLGVEQLSGNQIIPNSQPIALAYAGHQFGNFTILGDGRAILLGEHQTPNGNTVDIQLKGSGPTPFSRGGDGMATLKAMLKEHLFGEVLFNLGIPTSRSLALIASDDLVYRDKIHPRSILTRVASSHIRVGTFEFARRQDPLILKELADYTIQRHYPDLIGEDECYLKLLEKVMVGQAQLVAKWMSVGFIHGVLNTDNVSIACESIDFGPCAFMDNYSQTAVFSSIDRNGRYAYGNQAHITLWNLCRFAECLIPLINPNDLDLAVKKAESALSQFMPTYQSHWEKLFSRKIGFSEPSEISIELVNALLNLMEENELDFTHTFRQLSAENPNITVLNSWVVDWSKAHQESGNQLSSVKNRMLSINPGVIPRTHIIDPIIEEADSTKQLDSYIELLNILKSPFSSDHSSHALAQPRPTEIAPSVTYCGT